MGIKIRVDTSGIKPKAIMKRLGVDATGKVQDFTTQRILAHMRKFMPYREGVMAPSQTTQLTPTKIVVNAPQARYLYHGVKMKDPNGGGPFPISDENGEQQGGFRYRRGAHPIPTGEPLQYSHHENEHAGPYWDRTMMQYDGAQIAKEVEEYAKKLKS